MFNTKFESGLHAAHTRGDGAKNPRQWFEPSQTRCEPSQQLESRANRSPSDGPVKRLASSIPILLFQLIAWPLLGFLIIAFDDLGPSLASAFSLPAGNNIYVFLQWGLLTPIVVQLALRFPLLDRPARNAAIHTIAAAFLCLLRIVGEPHRSAVIARAPPPEYLAHSISRDLLIYASIAVSAHLFLLERRRAAAEEHALQAQAALADAERALLEQTLAPELIVRGLDEIARRIRDEPARAEPLIEVFSEFLRSQTGAELLTRELGE
jgi:hypothetical protein